jgi:hypothetical protein
MAGFYASGVGSAESTSCGNSADYAWTTAGDWQVRACPRTPADRWWAAVLGGRLGRSTGVSGRLGPKTVTGRLGRLDWEDSHRNRRY